MWQEVLTKIIGGIFVSILTSIFVHLYSFESRKKIHSLLCSIREENFLFEKALRYNDYDNAIHCAKRLLDKTEQVYSNIKPLTYLPRKKRFNLYVSLLN